MTKRNLFVFCILWLGVWGTLYAQITPAWTRRITPQHWQEIANGAVRSGAKNKVHFIDLSRRVTSPCAVKTTDQNWLRHKVFYSGLFSKQEKELLLNSLDYPLATLGKLAYLHDKHSFFYQKLLAQQKSQYINEQAFSQHQQILHDLAGTLQQYYLEQQLYNVVSPVFSEQAIRHLVQTAQPAAYVLTPQELKEFAGLPSLEGQQNWVQRKINTTTWQAEMLLNQQTQSLSPAEFENYYLAQSRLSYFNLLQYVLQRADAKRHSAIVRYRAALEEGGERLTDAQRGGKILFEFDTNPTTQNKEKLDLFTQNYEPYGTAEALGAPYEWALQYGSTAPELLGWQEGKRLRNLSPQACADELGPKTLELELQLEQMRAQPRANDADFYKEYFRLHATSQIYQTLLARAQFALHH